jgi:hypothetical protein
MVAFPSPLRLLLPGIAGGLRSDLDGASRRVDGFPISEPAVAASSPAATVAGDIQWS